MKTERFPSKVRLSWHWLTLAGVLASLTVPLTARADHGSNDAMEILVSTAVAYAVIDAAGGFDDHRHHRRHDVHYRDHRYDSRHHDRYDHRRWREWDRRHDYWRKDHHKHWSHHDKGRRDQRRDWKGHHPGRGDDRVRIRAYH